MNYGESVRFYRIIVKDPWNSKRCSPFIASAVYDKIDDGSIFGILVLNCHETEEKWQKGFFPEQIIREWTIFDWKLFKTADEAWQDFIEYKVIDNDKQTRNNSYTRRLLRLALKKSGLKNDI